MENKKSEASAPGKGDLDEQEDQKMEQFFALIRSFHEARSRWKDELVEKPRKKKKVRVSNDEEPQSSWVPTFQWEDFTEDIKFIKPPLILPSPCNNRKKLDGKKPKEDDDLELRLAL